MPRINNKLKKYSRIKKYRSTSKHIRNLNKKSKVIQRGGTKEEDDYTKCMDYVSSIPDLDLSLVSKLLVKIFDNNKTMFGMKKSLQDPFLKVLKTDPSKTNTFYLDWYLKRNPNYELFSELPDFDTFYDGASIYETLLAQIARDCLIMLVTKKRPLDNEYEHEKYQTRNSLMKESNTLQSQLTTGYIVRDNKDYIAKKKALINTLLAKESESIDKTSISNIFTKKLSNSDILIGQLNALLAEINECIKLGYKYKNIYEIIKKFMQYLSDNPDKKFTAKSMIETPLLLFPTYSQIHFQDVIVLMSSPIINFRISNRRRQIHSYFANSITDFRHDVVGHGRTTHKIYEEQEKMRLWYTEMSKVISIFFKYFYNDTQPLKFETEARTIIYDILDPKNKKLIICVVLFCLLHECVDNHYLFYIYILSNVKKGHQYIFTESLDRAMKGNNFVLLFPEMDKLDLDSISVAFSKIISEEYSNLKEPVTKLAKLENPNVITEIKEYMSN